MNYGLYLSANGSLISLHKQDVMANNLANVNTVGFKPDSVAARQRLPERLESMVPFADPKWMLERLGGGAHLQPTRIDLSQGPLTDSGNPLDVAIDGPGFFAVQSDRGGAGAQPLLTRDGRFTLSAQGELVMATGGARVLDDGNQPVRLDRSLSVEIDASGRVSQDGQVVAQLQIADVADAADLRKLGNNLLEPTAGRVNPAANAPRLRQGYIESSAVDPIMALNAMIAASKAAQANGKLMQYHDQIMGQAINTYGRVA